MKLDDVLMLAKAGFTRDQIVQLAAADHPEPKPEQTKAPEQAAAPEQAKTAEPAAELLEAVRDLKQTMQLNAMLGTAMPEQENADDILASIINPKGMTKGGK